MSHFTKIRTRLVELEFVKSALVDMRLSVSPSGRVRGYERGETQADLRLQDVSEGYDFGLGKNPSGTIDIVADWYRLPNFDRENFVSELTRKYAYFATKAQFEAEGFALAHEEEQDGVVHMVLRRMVQGGAF